MPTHLAYVVSSGERSAVVYAATRGKAKAQGALTLDCAFSEIESCRREAHWDTTEPTIPNLLDAGWIYECGGCGHHVCSNGCHYCATDAPVLDGKDVCCSAACVAKRDASLEEMRRRCREYRDAAQAPRREDG